MKFTSIDIQIAFDEAKPVLENITLIRNTVSEEIKNIEKFFQTNTLPDDFSLIITDPYDFGAQPDPVEDKLVEELLLWKADKKRIHYQCNYYDYLFCTESIRFRHQPESKKTILDAPLIETRFEIRKRVYENHLANFIKEISKVYRVHSLQINEGVVIAEFPF